MKKKRRYLETISTAIGCCIVSFCWILCHSCQKDELKEQGAAVAKVNVINAVVSGGLARVNVSEEKMDNDNMGDNLGEFTPSKQFLVSTARSTFLQVVPVSDTTKFWYNQEKQLSTGKTYGLLLSGTPKDVKTLFLEESNLPLVRLNVRKALTSADSIVHIRFMNLSPTLPKVNINIVNNSTLEASSLGYQEFTDFKAYSATANGPIRFEVRNASNNALITTYNFNAPFYRFSTVYVVMMGIYPTLPTMPFTDWFQLVTFVVN